MLLQDVPIEKHCVLLNERPVALKAGDLLFVMSKKHKESELFLALCFFYMFLFSFMWIFLTFAAILNILSQTSCIKVANKTVLNFSPEPQQLRQTWIFCSRGSQHERGGGRWSLTHPEFSSPGSLVPPVDKNARTWCKRKQTDGRPIWSLLFSIANVQQNVMKLQIWFREKDVMRWQKLYIHEFKKMKADESETFSKQMLTQSSYSWPSGSGDR